MSLRGHLTGEPRVLQSIAGPAPLCSLREGESRRHNRCRSPDGLERRGARNYQRIDARLFVLLQKIVVLGDVEGCAGEGSGASELPSVRGPQASFHRHRADSA